MYSDNRKFRVYKKAGKLYSCAFLLIISLVVYKNYMHATLGHLKPVTHFIDISKEDFFIIFEKIYTYIYKITCNHQKEKQLSEYHKEKSKCIPHFGEICFHYLYIWNICQINFQRGMYTCIFQLCNFSNCQCMMQKFLLLISKHKITTIKVPTISSHECVKKTQNKQL